MSVLGTGGTIALAGAALDNWNGGYGRKAAGKEFNSWKQSRSSNYSVVDKADADGKDIQGTNQQGGTNDGIDEPHKTPPNKDTEIVSKNTAPVKPFLNITT